MGIKFNNAEGAYICDRCNAIIVTGVFSVEQFENQRYKHLYKRIKKDGKVERICLRCAGLHPPKKISNEWNF